jgi:hypothetical protein
MNTTILVWTAIAVPGLAIGYGIGFIQDFVERSLCESREMCLFMMTFYLVPEGGRE